MAEVRGQGAGQFSFRGEHSSPCVRTWPLLCGGVGRGKEGSLIHPPPLRRTLLPSDRDSPYDLIYL